MIFKWFYLDEMPNVAPWLFILCCCAYISTMFEVMNITFFFIIIYFL